MLKRFAATAVCAIVSLAGAKGADAQGWSGGYVGGSAGGGFQRENASETVKFDTNLDGGFTDTIRTVAGADAFAPGFCGGLAVNATASAGCSGDEKGLDVGGRLGYDWQLGRLVVGAVADVSRTNVTDSVTAFSVTPAFYAFTRELNYVGGLRGRVGVGSDRVLVYGAGGGAWGNVEHRFTTSNAVNKFVRTGDSARAWGYQAGGGVEVRLGGHWSVTGEYLFTSLDDREESTIRTMGPAPATNPFILVNPAGTDLQRSEKFEFQAVRAGLIYRF